MTRNQIAALKYLILVSRVGTELSKRVMLFLIDQSKGLTQEVCLSLVEGREGYTAEEIRAAAHGTDAMNSANCPTHLNEILVAMQAKLHFNIHYGDFDPKREGDPFNTDGQFPGWPGKTIPSAREQPGIVKEGMPLRYTFWLGRGHYSRKAKYLRVSRQKLDSVNLERPRLKYLF